MNANLPLPPDAEETDRLLARRYRDTSPEFEARWVTLKRELRQAPAPRRWRWPAWTALGWIGALGAVALLVLVAIQPRSPEPAPAGPELSPQLAELFAMEAALERAVPLLDEENRTALLHLPAVENP